MTWFFNPLRSNLIYHISPLYNSYIVMKTLDSTSKWHVAIIKKSHDPK